MNINLIEIFFVFRKLPPADIEDMSKTELLSGDYKEVVTESPFLYLTCDLPPTPLFIDEFRENIIPQVRKSSIHTVYKFLYYYSKNLFLG